MTLGGVPWGDGVIAALLLASGGVVLVAALGLWRLPDFFSRMHAPALASTLAAWLVTAASIVFFSTRGGGLSLHVWLVIIVLSITAPVTTIVLARAALFRRRQAGDRLPPPLRGSAREPPGPGPGIDGVAPRQPSKGRRPG